MKTLLFVTIITLGLSACESVPETNKLEPRFDSTTCKNKKDSVVITKIPVKDTIVKK